MTSLTPILSVIVISHEQLDELRLCLESILAMRLPFPYEIVVSDDRSSDGTLELAQKYAEAYPKFGLFDGFYRPKIIASPCNSDVGNPVNNSQRSGYNRCNAYSYASGKYITHVDADDYFRPTADVYRRQVEALERHPECSLAMSNCLCLEEGAPLPEGHPWPFPRKMRDGEVLRAEEFIRGDYFRLNQCFMQRRNPAVNPVKLYGNRYVDSVITYHHLQFGDVVYVDACDYVYIEHPASVTGVLATQNRDKEILWCLGLYIPALIPVWMHQFLMGAYYQSVRRVIKMALAGYRLQPQNYASLEDLHIWIFDCFNRELQSLDKLRLRSADFLMRLMKKSRVEPQWAIYLLKLLLFGI